jgi:hypothetical protein
MANVSEGISHTKNQTAAMFGTICQARQGLNVRFNISERAGIEGQELCGKRKDASDSFRMKGDGADDHSWPKTSDFFDRFETPAISECR